MSERLLVTGASGKLGLRTVEFLMDKGVEPGSIIATTRTPARLSDLKARGVDVRKADFDDESSLASAFFGADKLALISTDSLAVPGQRLRHQIAAVKAAQAAGLRRIIYTSMPNPVEGSHIVFAGDHRGTEEAIKASGMDFTILRNGWYQENLPMYLPQAFASGQWFTASGEGRTAYVAHDDCANALAGALLHDDPSGKTYTLTGPDLLTNDEIASLASEVVKQQIAVFHLQDQQMEEGLQQAGVPPHMIPFLMGFEKNCRAGGIDILTDHVELLTGQKPRPLRQYFEENIAAITSLPKN